MTFNRETIQRRSAKFLFWAWHVIYSILAVFLVVPTLAIPLFNSVMNDNVPWHYLIYISLIVILPFVSMYVGARYFRKNHRLLMKYFYGFEMPFLFFLLVRVFTFRDDGLAVHWLMLNVLIGLTVWLAFLFIQQRGNTTDIPLHNDWPGTVGSTVLAGVGLYFGSLFLIIQLPNAVEFIAAIAEEMARVQWSDIADVLVILINPLWWLLGLFILFTFSLFLILPLAMIYLYIGQFLQRLPSLKATHWMLVVAVIAINIVIIHSTTQQNQQQVFKALETSNLPANHATLVEQRETIREGLLNAYLARYRYMSTTGISQRIQHNYSNTFGLSKDAAAIPQSIFNTLLKPFLYDGVSWNDQALAETYYAEFFDAPIQKAERDLILDTIKHTWEVSRDNEAGLLDAANHYVHLDEQSIDIKEDHNVATVTIQQTLQNLTYTAQETVLHFSLPEEAVLTGVWLSDDRKQLLKYPYAVAPKGAAQSVYKAEVNRRVDPALLEQTGPYQYRLRAYPVLAKSRRNVSMANKPGEPLYVRFSYQTLADSQGNWPMPEVLEKRNLFWDDETKHSVNGKTLYRTETFNGFPTPEALPKAKSETSTLVFQLGKQQIQAIERTKGKEPLPKTGRFAVIIDGSYSMKSHYGDALLALAELNQRSIQFDSYFCQTNCQPFSTDNGLSPPVFFGNSQTLQHLQAFSNIKHKMPHDAVLVLTDAGSYELEVPENPLSLSLQQPLWLVHLGDTIPYAYDDKVLDTLYRSKGGIATSAEEALRRYQLLGDDGSPAELLAPDDAKLVSVSDQYLWFARTTKAAASRPPEIAAAHWIKHLIRTMDTAKLDTLDQIHQVAKTNNIISHYSSMLVLVNDRQKEALKKAEQADDRFDREVETGKQTATTPSDPFAVPAVPEPEEWALIIIALMLLTYTLWRRKQDQIKAFAA